MYCFLSIVLFAAGSSFFKKILSSEENIADEITNVKDVSIAAFKQFLHFIYTNEIKNVRENVKDLLLLAARYEITDLKKICAQKLEDNVKNSNASEYFSIADRFQLNDLKLKAFKIIQNSLLQLNQKLSDEMIDSPEIVLKAVQLALQLAATISNIEPEVKKEVTNLEKTVELEKRGGKIVGKEFLKADGKNDQELMIEGNENEMEEKSDEVEGETKNDSMKSNLDIASETDENIAEGIDEDESKKEIAQEIKEVDRESVDNIAEETEEMTEETKENFEREIDEEIVQENEQQFEIKVEDGAIPDDFETSGEISTDGTVTGNPHSFEDTTCQEKIEFEEEERKEIELDKTNPSGNTVDNEAAINIAETEMGQEDSDVTLVFEFIKSETNESPETENKEVVTQDEAEFPDDSINTSCIDNIKHKEATEIEECDKETQEIKADESQVLSEGIEKTPQPPAEQKSDVKAASSSKTMSKKNKNRKGKKNA